MNFVMKARDGYYEFGTTTLPIGDMLTHLTLHRRAMDLDDANQLLDYIRSTFIEKRIEDYCYALNGEDIQQIRQYAGTLSGYIGTYQNA